MIDCSKCIHNEVCANKVVNDGLGGECGFFKAEQPQGDLISREWLREEFKKSKKITFAEIVKIACIVDSAPTVEPFEPDYVGAERLKARQRGYEEGYHNGMEMGKTLNPKIKQGECITCKHRDPEDKKCDCGAQERQGCPFPVSDDYFCKYYEKGGAE